MLPGPALPAAADTLGPASAIRVLLVEDEPHTRERFSAAVQADRRYRLTAACADMASALQQLALQAPDVLLTDLGLPDGSGLEVIRVCARSHPACDIMVISMFGDEAHVLSSIEAGATGYILKSSEDHEIITHIDALRAGGSPITPSIARQLLRRFRVAVPAPTDSAPQAVWPDALTEREAEVLALVARGYRHAEIGQRLFISPHTVVAHVKNIYQKLAVKSRSAAVYEAQRRNWLPSAWPADAPDG